MRYTTFFLISPRAVLVTRLEADNGVELPSLGQSVVWSGEESDKSKLTASDYESIVKLLFLDVLKRESESVGGFDLVFFDFALSESYFDSLWTLQRVPLDMSVEIALKDSLITDTIDEVKSTSNERVQEWLSACHL